MMPVPQVKNTDHFFVWRDPKNKSFVEVRINFAGRDPKALPPAEMSLYTALHTSLTLVNRFLRYLAVLPTPRQPGTIYEYAKILRYCLEWFGLKPVNLYGTPVPLSFLRLSHDDAASLLAWLSIPATKEDARVVLAKTGVPQPELRESPVSDHTKNLRETCLHTFYEWLMTTSLPDVAKPKANPIKTAPRPTPTPPPGEYKKAEDRGLRVEATHDVLVLEPEEYTAVLEAIPKISYLPNQARRDELIIRAMTIGVMRPSELPLWSWAGVNKDKREMEVPTVKWGRKHKKPRKVYLDEELYRLMVEYTGEMTELPPHQARSGPVIRNLRDESKPVTKRVVEDLFGKLVAHFQAQAKLANTDSQPSIAEFNSRIAANLHPHILRKTGATYWAASGVDIVILAEMLGHRQIETTRRYYIAAQKLNIAERLHEASSKFKQLLNGEQASPSRTEADEMLERVGWSWQ